jgi:Flp pilus assembly protein TadG
MKPLGSTLSHFFSRDERGAVALVFALSLMVLVGFAGAALDYSRASMQRSQLQAALDAAALGAAKTAEGKSLAVIKEEALRLLKANADGKGLTNLSLDVTQAAGRLHFTASGASQTVVANVLGVSAMTLGVSAEVAWGTTKMEIALVLDNTLSMASSSKMTTLKTALQDFLNTMQANATTADAIKIAIVPFSTSVRLPSSLRTASWINSQYVNPATWPGCVWDRDQPNDASDAAPVSGGTLFRTELRPGDDDDDPPEATCSVTTPVLPLTNDFTALRNTVTAMTPSGYTNLTVGLVWGLHMLTPSEPITNAVALGTPGVKKFIVFLTDGENTRNRWSTSQTSIDARTTAVCNAIRTATPIEVYTIRVMEGNATLLRSCATVPSMYYEANSASDIIAVFAKIAKELTQLRLSR